MCDCSSFILAASHFLDNHAEMLGLQWHSRDRVGRQERLLAVNFKQMRPEKNEEEDGSPRRDAV